MTGSTPFCICFITDQRNILKAASILNDTEDYKDVYIKKDDTPLERALTNKLNVLRKSRTEESRKKGENVRWFIRRGQVVNGKPKPGGAEGGGQKGRKCTYPSTCSK